MAFRYFTRYDIVTREHEVLYRIDDENEGIYYRWDRPTALWIRDPAGIAETGIGGDPNYDDVTEGEARRLLDEWGAPDDALARGSS